MAAAARKTFSPKLLTFSCEISVKQSKGSLLLTVDESTLCSHSYRGCIRNFTFPFRGSKEWGGKTFVLFNSVLLILVLQGSLGIIGKVSKLALKPHAEHSGRRVQGQTGVQLDPLISLWSMSHPDAAWLSTGFSVWWTAGSIVPLHGMGPQR